MPLASPPPLPYAYVSKDSFNMYAKCLSFIKSVPYPRPCPRTYFPFSTFRNSPTLCMDVEDRETYAIMIRKFREGPEF